MPNCQTCGNYIPNDTICGSCFAKEYRKTKAEQKAKDKQLNKFSKFQNRPKSERTIKLDKLKKQLQSLWSAKMKQIYKDKGVYFDWIDGKANNAKGLHGLHVAHFYPKGKLWQLWIDPVNSGIASHKHNVEEPETAPMMLKMMLKVWGDDAVNDLHQRAEDYRLRISLGIDKRHPDEMILMGMIKELKE